MSTFFEDEDELDHEQEESFFSPPRAGPSRARAAARRQPHRAPTEDVERLILEDDADENKVQRLWRRLQNERNAPELLQDDPDGDLNACLQTLMLQVRPCGALLRRLKRRRLAARGRHVPPDGHCQLGRGRAHPASARPTGQ
jgi:hypothetical protein